MDQHLLNDGTSEEISSGSFQSNLLHLEQPVNARLGRCDHSSEISGLIERSQLCRGGSRSRGIWYAAPSGIHPLEDVVFVGERWQHLQMEVLNPRSGESSFGTCLWIGPRLGEVLPERRQSTHRDWDSRLERRFILGSSSGLQDSGRNEGNRPRVRRQISFPGRGYISEEFALRDISNTAELPLSLAVRGSEESSVSRSSPDHLRL